MARAISELYSHSDERTEIWTLAAATPARTLVSNGGRYGITLTDTEGVTSSKTIGQYTITGITKPGASLEPITDAANNKFPVTVRLDGTWIFEDVVSSGTTPAPTTTDQGVAVYVTSGGALTLASSGNTKIGTVNYSPQFNKVAGKLPVKIGG